jgi:hypothetical protein
MPLEGESNLCSGAQSRLWTVAALFVDEVCRVLGHQPLQIRCSVPFSRRRCEPACVVDVVHLPQEHHNINIGFYRP